MESSVAIEVDLEPGLDLLTRTQSIFDAAPPVRRDRAGAGMGRSLGNHGGSVETRLGRVKGRSPQM
jgi:hypothetical protein